ncbi:SGNH/GDSL hydrolase family protein [Paenibacillus sp. HB172176]|uniref:SGNH/GDSL hydrolase family protein n=1 Tax=Paenibacillus sp. HB172176 TaxID=2493690 RepID=UPI001438BF0E|nr:SGNH/GDSL hydrolase family protein [Paenibacillus sp. HB172176]
MIAVQGMRVVPTVPVSMAVMVEPGTIIWDNGETTVLKESVKLQVQSSGTQAFKDHAYQIRGEADKLPGYWNGESIRGSGGAPYQRMIPGTLTVYNESRSIPYQESIDYIVDWYWGTVKRKAGGAIARDERLSVDYEVYLCRYDAVAISRDGQFKLIRGSDEAPESRELLLPDPPMVREGRVLAHLFVGWGATAIHDGEYAIRHSSGTLDELDEVRIRGRYMDMIPRTYFIQRVKIDEALSSNEGSGLESMMIRTGATGEEYGTGMERKRENMLWTEPQSYVRNEPIPLLLQSAYGFPVDWGLSLDVSLADRAMANEALSEISVTVYPHAIFDMRDATNVPDSAVTIRNSGGAARLNHKMEAGENVRIAYYGESTSRSGRWPYLVASQLRGLYPHSSIKTSNMAVGGESSLKGFERLSSDVLKVNPDFVFIEYMLNDMCSGMLEQTLELTERMISGILESGAECAIVTVNGMNPQFHEQGSARLFRSYHDKLIELADRYGVVFIGGYDYFEKLHEFGRYFLTELKGNMINHSWGNVDRSWGSFDDVLAKGIDRLWH